jgi:peptidoglycan LD-endopeptidase CwlK
MRIEEMIAAIQRELDVDVDGKAGPQTWGAIYSRLVKKRIAGQKPAAAISAVDSRSERNIVTLRPEVQPIARALVQKAALSGITVKVVSGLRTYAEQDALYAQGRSRPGHIVTHAKGGYSNHNFGIAFDVAVFEGSRCLLESIKYKAVGVATGRTSSISHTFSYDRPGLSISTRSKCSRNCAQDSVPMLRFTCSHKEKL